MMYTIDGHLQDITKYEIPVCPDLIENLHGLKQSVFGCVFSQSVVGCVFSHFVGIRCDVHNEQDGGRILEHLYPLPPFTLLTTGIIETGTECED